MTKRGLLCLCLCLLLGACTQSSPSPTPRPSASPRIVTIQSGANPDAIAVLGEYAWVGNSAEGTIWKVDVRTNKVVDKIVVGDPQGIAGCVSHNVHQTPHGDFRIRNCDLPKAVVASTNAIWTGRGDTNALVRIDPGTDRVVATIPVGVEPWYIVATDTAVWLSDWHQATVIRVDPVTNQVAATISGLAVGPSGIAVTPDAVWVASSQDSVLSRIDPATNRVVTTIPTQMTPETLLYAYGSLWVRDVFDGYNATLQRIDPVTNQVVTSIPVEATQGRDGLDSLAAFDGGVWLCGLWLDEISPATNQQRRRVNHSCNGVTPGAGSLWTIDIAYSVSRVWP